MGLTTITKVSPQQENLPADTLNEVLFRCLPMDSQTIERSADAATVSAISLIVYALSSVLHEGAGHGLACALTGHTPLVLSTVHFECDHDTVFIAAAGTIVNLIAGALCWAVLRLGDRLAPRLRYFLWLLMTVNLLDAGGYFLFSGFGNIGDWAFVIQDLHPAWLWRVLLVLIGAVSYYFFVLVSLRELRPFVAGPEWNIALGKKLTLVPYFAGGILSCAAGAFNPVGMILVAISAAAASFGGTSALAWMIQLLRGKPSPGGEALAIPRSYAWMVAAALTAAFFIAVVGPGVRFH